MKNKNLKIKSKYVLEITHAQRPQVGHLWPLQKSALLQNTYTWFTMHY